MKIVIMGHRGTGKSHLLERLKFYFSDPGDQDIWYFDLDKEIEFREGKTVSQIFEEYGEKKFRELEVAVLTEIVSKNKKFIIALGAGFPLQQLPHEVEKVWVRRRTDSLGRVFLNRPRLNPDLSPLEEYLKRLPLREESYRSHCDWEYTMPEGIMKPHAVEKKIFRKDFDKIGGYLTLLPRHFENTEYLQNVIRSFDVDSFELRDDLLSLPQIQLAVSLLPNRRILMSLRKENTDPWVKEFLRTGVRWDWAAELGDCNIKGFNDPILSVHQLPEGTLTSLCQLEQFIHKISLKVHRQKISHIKLAPIVRSFAELSVLNSWFNQSPEERSILPRSLENGSWHWFRLYQKKRQLINFFRTDQGSALDQPTVFEWLQVEEKVFNFAAVLGHPVFHSRTPLEQEDFFAKRKMPVFAIDVEGTEFDEAMSFLDDLGLRAAAVTSPLKNFAFQFSPYRSALANDLGTVNTLSKKDQVWFSHNTDLEGFRALVGMVTGNHPLVVSWGGGGTLPVIRKILPHVWNFSVRNRAVRTENDDQIPRSFEEKERLNKKGPDLLIWAAAPDAQFPPDHWQPKVVLDLNYREDSLAREYALTVNAQYIDGLKMFVDQARAQRDYWERN